MSRAGEAATRSPIAFVPCRSGTTETSSFLPTRMWPPYAR